jgi:hypothetical protein
MWKINLTKANYFLIVGLNADLREYDYLFSHPNLHKERGEL